MIKYKVKNRYTRDVQFTAKIDCDDGAPISLKLRLAALWAIENIISLRGANLSGVSLSGLDLSDTDLRGTNLRDVNLRDVNLRDVNLRQFKHDIWGVCLLAVGEVPNLISAIKEGRIDGSQYAGECCCLCGTLEKGEPSVVNIRDESSPAEQWFYMISKGDTPETNSASKQALEWVEEFYAKVSV